MALTGPDGSFGFYSVPLGPFTLKMAAIDFSGIAHLQSALTVNGQTNDLGVIVLDEDDPVVVEVIPADNAVDVPTTNSIDLFFSKALDASTVTPQGIFLRYDTNPVPATVQLLPDPTNGILRLVRLTPSTRLLSQKTYSLVVISGTWTDGLGHNAQGPADPMGRILPAPFRSSFTTADNDPPVLLSMSPADGDVQIDPLAVMRLSFNEAIQSSGYTVSLIGPAGPVAGTAAVGLNGLVLAFTPAAALEPNALYTLTVDGIQDLAGNLATNQPFTATFATIDTIGPSIAALRVADGRSPVAGPPVPVEAVLAGNESRVSVRFTQDLAPVGVATNPPYRATVTLPMSGSTTVRAIATDRYGNDGPLAELIINVLSNQPPTVTLVRTDASGSTVTNGQTFVLRVTSADDDVVTNVTLVGLGAVPFAASYPDGQAHSVQLTVSNIAPSRRHAPVPGPGHRQRRPKVEPGGTRPDGRGHGGPEFEPPESAAQCIAGPGAAADPYGGLFGQ